jgi:hypothetical protein
MKRLYAAIAVLVPVWSVSMAFFAASAYNDNWTLSIVGLVALVVFFGLGGLLMPTAQRAATTEDRKGAFWLVQFFGAVVTTELLLAALLAWIAGNRTHQGSNAYQVLGLIIFLALLGAAQGVPATFTFFLARRGQRKNDEAAAALGVPAVHH